MSQILQALRDTLPWLVWTLPPLFLLLLAPLCGTRGRTTIATVLVLGALPMGWLAFTQRAAVARAEVVNRFPAGPDKVSTRFVIEVVERPAWQWPLVGLAALLVPALLLLVQRERRPAPPAPALHCALLGSHALAVRLALEKTAAPPDLHWAIGVSLPLVLLLPFLGAYCGLRRMGVAAWVAQLFLLGLLHRGVVVAVGWFCTTRHLGTHLDVSPIHEVNLFLQGPMNFRDDPAGAWTALLLIPQLAIWIPVTVALGLLLGVVPYLAARRRKS